MRNSCLAGAVTIRVRVTPRNGRDVVTAWRDSGETLPVRVSAFPVDGAASQSCPELVAGPFRLKKAQVSWISGASARDKQFALDSITEGERNRILQALPPLAAPAA